MKALSFSPKLFTPTNPQPLLYTHTSSFTVSSLHLMLINLSFDGPTVHLSVAAATQTSWPLTNLNPLNSPRRKDTNRYPLHTETYQLPSYYMWVYALPTSSTSPPPPAQPPPTSWQPCGRQAFHLWDSPRPLIPAWLPPKAA